MFTPVPQYVNFFTCECDTFDVAILLQIHHTIFEQVLKKYILWLTSWLSDRLTKISPGKSKHKIGHTFSLSHIYLFSTRSIRCGNLRPCNYGISFLTSHNVIPSDQIWPELVQLNYGYGIKYPLWGRRHESIEAIKRNLPTSRGL